MSEKDVDHGGREHSLKRALCVCIDDFGMQAGINEASLQLIGMGRVHALGCMVGGPAWRAGHPALHGLDQSQVDIGLHLDFTEFPLRATSPAKLSTLIRASYLRQLDAGEVRAEIKAQLDAFEQALGRPPAFVDGHQHVHQLPVIRQALVRELQARYPGSRLWLRSTRTSASWWGPAKPRIIEWLGSRGLRSMARKVGFPHNHKLLGVYDFQGGEQRYRHLVASWLHRAEHADLLMTHPSLPQQDGDVLTEARVAEFQVLAGKPFGSMLTDEGITLLPMSMILSDP